MSLDFAHLFIPATRVGLPPLLLLHGTGGDERDLVGLGQVLLPGAALLSPRGKVSEGGMPRFFSRLAEGVFDPEEVRRRADELADFIGAAADRYALAPPVAVGFSNGANVAGVILMRRPASLSGAILLRPMTVLRDPAIGGLDGKAVLALSGTRDPIVPPGSAETLAAILMAGGGVVEHRSVAAGHGLTEDDMVLARSFLSRHFGEPADGPSAVGPSA